MILNFGGEGVSAYNTEQKRLLEEFLIANNDRSLTVEEISEGLMSLSGEGVPSPARSTVYRLVSRLEAEGRVRRFVRSGSRRAAYQLSLGDHCDSHLHLKCVGCGRLVHMDERVSEELLDRINSSNGFSVNEEETVLFGRCFDCKKMERGRA